MPTATDPPPLVLPPGLAFGQLCALLEAAGWQLHTRAALPLVADEPEHAGFAQGGQLLHYSFNPVCQLRLLHAAPGFGLPQILPQASDADVTAWLAAEDERSVLRGLLAAQALRDTQWADAVGRHRQHRHAAVRAAAQRALQALSGLAGEDPAAAARSPYADAHAGPQSDMAAGISAPAALGAAARTTGHKDTNQEPVPAGDAQATAQAMAQAAAQVLLGELEPLLLALAHDPGGAVSAALRPRPGDAARAFRPDVAAAAGLAYDRAWAEAPPLPRASAQARVQAQVAPAGLLDHDNPLSHAFPGGYRRIAPLLQPQRVWAAWKVLQPGASVGMAHDGLVWLDDHWAWFPKPYRVLAHLVPPASA